MNSDIKDYLIEEYKYLSDSFWKSEQIGETRVNWFIGIFTAGVGGIISLVTSGHKPSGGLMQLTILFVLLALLVFGITTQFRIMKSNLLNQTS